MACVSVGPSSLEQESPRGSSQGTGLNQKKAGVHPQTPTLIVTHTLGASLLPQIHTFKDKHLWITSAFSSQAKTQRGV